MANLGKVQGVAYVIPTTTSADTPVELSAHDRQVMESNETVEVSSHEDTEVTELTHQ